MNDREIKLSDVKKVIAEYHSYQIGYDQAIDNMVALGLTEGQADNMLFADKRTWKR